MLHYGNFRVLDHFQIYVKVTLRGLINNKLLLTWTCDSLIVVCTELCLALIITARISIYDTKIIPYLLFSASYSTCIVKFA